MQINTQGRVAIAAILEVAVHGVTQPVSLSGISQRQHVSLSYLEQLFKKLRQKGIVASYRGPGGGYRLNRQLATLSVADVIDAVDGKNLEQGSDGGSHHAADGHAGVTDDLWRRVNDHLYDYLRSVSLESILTKARKPEDANEAPATAAPAPWAESALSRPEEQSAATI